VFTSGREPGERQLAITAPKSCGVRSCLSKSTEIVVGLRRQDLTLNSFAAYYVKNSRTRSPAGSSIGGP
jgi:hypothetical protein